MNFAQRIAKLERIRKQQERLLDKEISSLLIRLFGRDDFTLDEIYSLLAEAERERNKESICGH